MSCFRHVVSYQWHQYHVFNISMHKLLFFKCMHMHCAKVKIQREDSCTYIFCRQKVLDIVVVNNLGNVQM